MLLAALLSFWSLAVLAAAQGGSQCASGDVVCCDTVQSADTLTGLLSSIGVSGSVAADLGLVGLKCTELTVIGRGKSCVTKQVPLCCTDNNLNGTVSLGCAYIDPKLV